ncbi:unnamed protein product [Prorocentrum cordatum]|uniref:Skin secretory protein xP2-like n=1 Tax=Prorocentrum cordatum TaxID=2364126 RepID=A0ABN9XKY2_9DINO|nr:unnamed protein product [Polarella glacialis]
MENVGAEGALESQAAPDGEPADATAELGPPARSPASPACTGASPEAAAGVLEAEEEEEEEGAAAEVGAEGVAGLPAEDAAEEGAAEGASVGDQGAGTGPAAAAGDPEEDAAPSGGLAGLAAEPDLPPASPPAGPASTGEPMAAEGAPAEDADPDAGPGGAAAGAPAEDAEASEPGPLADHSPAGEATEAHPEARREAAREHREASPVPEGGRSGDGAAPELAVEPAVGPAEDYGMGAKDVVVRSGVLFAVGGGGPRNGTGRGSSAVGWQGRFSGGSCGAQLSQGWLGFRLRAARPEQSRLAATGPPSNSGPQPHPGSASGGP